MSLCDTTWTIHEVNAVLATSATRRPAFEFCCVIKMQGSGNASHWPVCFYAYFLEPCCFRQYTPAGEAVPL
jgi:hypothetical protein